MDLKSVVVEVRSPAGSLVLNSFIQVPDRGILHLPEGRIELFLSPGEITVRAWAIGLFGNHANISVPTNSESEKVIIFLK